MPLIDLILERHGAEAAGVGDFLLVEPDRLLLCDALGVQVLQRLTELEGTPAFPPERTVATCGRNFPPRDIATSNSFRRYRELVSRSGVVFHGPEEAGVLHNVLAETGDLRWGELVLGTDSHTLTAGAFGCLGFGVGVDEMIATLRYGRTWLRVPRSVKVELRGAVRWPMTERDAMFHLMRQVGQRAWVGKLVEFWDLTDSGLGSDERMTFCSLAAELGVFSALFAPREMVTSAAPVADILYDSVITLDLGEVREPIVALPHSPGNLRPLSEAVGTPITHCFVGTCSGSGITGLRQAARILEGERVHPDVTLIVTPQSRGVYREALGEGILEVLVAAGAVVTTPGCGACLASHSGVLAAGDVCVSTGNRNFRGRMGDAGAAIYLASVPVTALAAIHGELRALPAER